MLGRDVPLGAKYYCSNQRRDCVCVFFFMKSENPLFVSLLLARVVFQVGR